jgi:hypothetical protein
MMAASRRARKEFADNPLTVKRVDELADGLPTDTLPALTEWRNKHVKQIDAAVKLLGPKSRDDVETALIEIQFEYNQLTSGFAPNKFAKKAIKKFLPGLRRVEALMRNEALPFGISYSDANTVAEILERCEKVVAAAPASNPRKGAEYKRLVVRKAAALMGKYNAPRSSLVKLANVLYGEKNVNLTSQCVAYIREARKAK